MILSTECSEALFLGKRSMTVRGGRSNLSYFKWAIAAALILSVGLGVPNNVPAEGPAVSAVNAKADALFGSMDSKGTTIGLGSITLPLGDQFGSQIDGGWGKVSSYVYDGVGGHVFWRDPDYGLIGLIGSYQELDNVSVIQNGAEGELYLKDFTFRTRMGYQYGDVNHGVFAKLGVKYYLMDNLTMEVDPEVAAGDCSLGFGLEYQPDFGILPGLAIFAEGEVGENDYDHWFCGISYYFGSKKSLEQRHREDNIDSLLPDFTKHLMEKVRHAERKKDIVSPQGGEGEEPPPPDPDPGPPPGPPPG